MGIGDRIAAARERSATLDHTLAMQEHYGQVKASQQAGGVTYFAFLSFFPVLALAVFVVGIVARVYPDANQDLVSVIDDVLPGFIGNGEGQLSLDDVQTFSGVAAVVGVLGVLYAGLGWISSLRDALMIVFEKPLFERPNFVLGKLRDLVVLAIIGLTLFVSVGVTGVVRGFSGGLLDLVGLDSTFGWVVSLISVAVGLAVNALLFYLMFRLAGEPDLPSRSLWQGAALGAVVFELLKLLSQFLLGATKEQPAFQAFGIALILLVWINYFSRVVLYAACWAYTTPEARALRTTGAPPVQGPRTPSLVGAGRAAWSGEAQPAAGRRWLTPFATGAAAMLGLVAVLRRRDR